LRLADLRARYGIGASPLREALFRLAAQKLVLQENNRGFRVPPLSRDEWDDIVAMRRQLEPAAAEASVRRGDEAWEEQLLLAHRRLKRLGNAVDLLAPLQNSRTGEWEEFHRQFHFALIAACGSDWTIRFCALLNDQFDRFRRFAIPARAVQTELADQHDALLEHALSRDESACRALLDEHIRMTGDAVAHELKRLV
jgi:DNA-binding GntR family transcriptional regulator